MNKNDYTLDDETTFHVDYELQALAPGATLCNGKYRLEQVAGNGGMGVVWKAWDVTGERWVALKFLDSKIRHLENEMNRVKAAFGTIQALSHPNICPVYGLENDVNYGYFVVMRWLDGKPLNDAKLSKEQIPVVLGKVADALDHAHGKKVIHRDVKPSNIMLADDGEVYLIDFGLAKRLHTETQATQGQFSVAGTEKYMAPEQKKGEYQSARTDQYALALVALELMIGSLSPLAIRKIPPEVQDVLDKALKDDPKARYETCREFVNALTSLRRDDVPVVQRTSSSAKSAMEQVLDAEREAEEAQRRAEEARRRAEAEVKQKRIQDLDKIIAEEYRSGRYTEALGHIEELQKLDPGNQDARKLKKRCDEKLAEKKRSTVAVETGNKPKTGSGKYVLWGIGLAFVLFIMYIFFSSPFEMEGTRLVKYTGQKTNVVIPEGVTEIGWSAFSGCSSLTSVVIPEGVTGIGNLAFKDCSSLTSVVIPESVTVIGERAFKDCGSLTSVEIPEGVTVIGDCAFDDCSSLTSVVIPEGVTEIGEYAFAGCPNLAIHGKKGSKAEEYAEEKGIPFEAM